MVILWSIVVNVLELEKYMNEQIRSLAQAAGLNFAHNISGTELVFGTFEGEPQVHVCVEELNTFVELVLAYYGVEE